MVRGIWQGFQNMSGWLESKVRSMMREIVAAVEAEMQIASPSKVFAGIGAYMAEGLGEGFAREMQNVEKTIRRATASTVRKDRPEGSAGTTTPPAACKWFKISMRTKRAMHNNSARRQSNSA